ncbi:MAG: hypothetical protein ACFFDR_13605 [Candidatus Thorarchaeota archaeon]
MSRYRIALATTKPKTFYMAVRILQRLGLKFRSCTPDDHFCKEAKLVITTAEEMDGIDSNNLLVIDEIPDEITTSLDVMTHYLATIPPREIIIGVDPGLHNGIAVLVDGAPVFGRVLASPIDASILIVKLVKHTRKRYAQSMVYTRIGLGSKLYSTLLLRQLLRAYPDLLPELVDERNTTTQGGYFKDQFSAELIALRTGRDYNADDLQIEAKRGFIRGLQHLFVWLTDKKGVLTIEKARRILQDELTLEEVLLEFHALEKKRSTA